MMFYQNLTDLEKKELPNSSESSVLPKVEKKLKSAGEYFWFNWETNSRARDYVFSIHILLAHQ